MFTRQRKWIASSSKTHCLLHVFYHLLYNLRPRLLHHNPPFRIATSYHEVSVFRCGCTDPQVLKRLKTLCGTIQPEGEYTLWNCLEDTVVFGFSVVILVQRCCHNFFRSVEFQICYHAQASHTLGCHFQGHLDVSLRWLVGNIHCALFLDIIMWFVESILNDLKKRKKTLFPLPLLCLLVFISHAHPLIWRK